VRTDHLFEKYYYSRPTFVDGTTEFHRLLSKTVSRSSSILEIGAGPSNRTSQFLAGLGRVTGVDVSDEVRTNSFLADASVFDGVNLPFPDGHFDVCVSDWVIEHVKDAEAHFQEARRVLKCGGAYVFRTPNRWHYFVIGSRLLPFGVHVRLANRLRGRSREHHDPYLTYYRANSLPRIQSLSRKTGLVVDSLCAVEKEPSYGRLHPILFWPMLAYERCVNSCRPLHVFGASLLGVLRKPASTAQILPAA
jgi:SAM-dependent methyltransferase